MKTKYKGLIFLSLALVTLILLIPKLNIDTSIFYSIKHIPYIVIAALLILILPIILAFRMRYLLLAIEGSSQPIKSLSIVEYMNKFLYNTTPLKMNLPAKAVLLNKICKVKMRNGVSIVTFEYALDVSTTLLFALLGVILYFKNISQISIAKLAFFATFLVVSVLIFFNIPHNIFDKFTQYAENLHLKIIKTPIHYLSIFLKAIRETWTTLIFNKKMYHVFTISLLYWSIFIISIEFLFLSTGVYVPLVWILVVSTCAVFVGGISTIPGGLGVREATMILLYGILGVSYKIALVVVILLRILLWLPPLIGYILTFSTGLRYIKK